MHTPIIEYQLFSRNPLVAHLFIVVWQQPSAIVTVEIDALLALLLHKPFGLGQQ